jgi:ABC-type multidrug transport system ATPase subunit
MSARLGFAVATEFRPEILILDEVLSVGDEHFRQKCAVRLERFWDAHSTIITVSHDLNFVRTSCDRVLWLNQGRLVFDGSANEGCDAYLRDVNNLAPKAIVERDELLHLASTSARGEIVIRGLSETEMGHRIYLVRDGQRHWIRSSEEYGRTGYGWEDIIHVADEIIWTIPEGEVLS